MEISAHIYNTREADSARSPLPAQEMQGTASVRCARLARTLAAAALCTSGLLEADEQVLDRGGEVRDLWAADAARRHSVGLRGIVTYSDPEAPDLFIRDESA